MNAVLDHAPRIISTQHGLQWLVLPDEAEKTYTNFGYGEKGDASELVTEVNADPVRNLGHADWRLPTIDELKTLLDTTEEPQHLLCVWSSTQCDDPPTSFACGDEPREVWCIDFADEPPHQRGCVYPYPDHAEFWVRLVRTAL